MNTRFIFVAGALLIAAQSMTAFADDSDPIGMNVSSSASSDTSMTSDADATYEAIGMDMISDELETEMSAEDVAQGGTIGDCTCVRTRYLTKKATSQTSAENLAKAEVKSGEKFAGCVPVAGKTDVYKCTITYTDKTTRRTKDLCEKDTKTLTEKYVPKYYDSILCTYKP